METNTRRLHPLATAAAVSIMVFSAVGVAAITGLIPNSKGSAQETSPLAQAGMPPAKGEAVAPAKQEPAPAPAPKPLKKQLAKAPAPAAVPYPAEPFAYRDFHEPARVAAAPAPVVVEAPKPAVKPGVLATIVAVREVEEAGAANGAGAVAGGLAGAVLGHNIGEHNKLVTVLGAAGGALLGNHIEKQARATKRWEMVVRFDDGTTQVISSDVQPYWQLGERVRVHEGRVQPV